MSKLKVVYTKSAQLGAIQRDKDRMSQEPKQSTMAFSAQARAAKMTDTNSTLTAEQMVLDHQLLIEQMPIGSGWLFDKAKEGIDIITASYVRRPVDRRMPHSPNLDYATRAHGQGDEMTEAFARAYNHKDHPAHSQVVMSALVYLDQLYDNVLLKMAADVRKDFSVWYASVAFPHLKMGGTIKHDDSAYLSDVMEAQNVRNRARWVYAVGKYFNHNDDRPDEKYMRYFRLAEQWTHMAAVY